MFGNMGFWEIFAIVFAVLLLFGAKKIPELAQGIGKGMKEFKKALKDVEEEVKSVDDGKDKK
ncbi:MAG: twin-arginine translocase TatA/TatE family subunit [Ignavibacteriales bacterium]|nr:twin-arginine translocase TatA/TatE family subunit [Ignavibacteriales bacterium]MCF8306906.1 twin-arginine translocase TatA/TatE family subunit [Ignavibacteriales bacterium]MCF8438148.1 twin-arginine translocase TatA/TatE family subunit [Ignavibacteriales bacterium]